MTQDQRLLHYLAENKQIDPLTSWKELGIYRLSSCVHRLRKEGWGIKTGRKEIINSHGEKCVVALYNFSYPPFLDALNGCKYDDIKGVIDFNSVRTLLKALKHRERKS